MAIDDGVLHPGMPGAGIRVRWMHSPKESQILRPEYFLVSLYRRDVNVTTAIPRSRRRMVCSAALGPLRFRASTNPTTSPRIIGRAVK